MSESNPKDEAAAIRRCEDESGGRVLRRPGRDPGVEALATAEYNECGPDSAARRLSIPVAMQHRQWLKDAWREAARWP